MIIANSVFRMKYEKVKPFFGK